MVPESQMLTEKEILKSNIFSILKKDKLLSNMPSIAMALFVLYLKFENSNNIENELAKKWEIYLNTFPGNFNTPLFFDLEEIYMIKPSESLSNF